MHQTENKIFMPLHNLLIASCFFLSNRKIILNFQSGRDFPAVSWTLFATLQLICGILHWGSFVWGPFVPVSGQKTPTKISLEIRPHRKGTISRGLMSWGSSVSGAFCPGVFCPYKWISLAGALCLGDLLSWGPYVLGSFGGGLMSMNPRYYR